ncbi:MAG TPA: hypothetical protein VGX23_14990 [Actinocrinis sp.]|nr:hypothetical protein [Actinocrinis sp.]
MHDHTREAAHGPSPAASVVLELTDRIGALIIDATADLVGTEIEISRAGTATRTHSMVRERLTEPHRQYSAVYPSLEAGEYTIWHEDGDSTATITVTAGHVARFVYPQAN